MTEFNDVTRKRERWIAFLASISVCIVLATLLAVAQVYAIRGEQKAKAEKLIHSLDNIIDDGVQTLKKLNNFEHKICSNANIIEMRKKLFISQYIRDIGFFIDGYLCCTTGLGVLPKPFLGSPPDYVTPNGYEIWVNAELQLFDLQYSAIIIRKDKYNVVFDYKSIETNLLQPFNWEVVLNGDNKNLSIVGSKNLYNPHKKSISLFCGITDHYYAQCSEKYPYCVALNLDNITLANSYFLDLLLLAISSISIAIIIYFVVERFFRNYFSVDVRVKKGVRNNSFSCLYQPIVDLKTMKIVGCEALARFEDHQGSLMPDQFLSSIKKYGLTWRFTEQLIATSLRELSAYNLPDNFKVSYNIFPHDVLSNDISKLPALCTQQQHNLNIVFEIIEDEYLDEKTSQQNLASLRNAGFQVAIDDFGTGYSNLNQLKKIECQFLKIDRTFIIDMEEGSIKSSLVKHIVDIAHGADLEVIAEGIENVMQLHSLIELGVEFGQGWAFGKPMPLRKLSEELANMINL